MPLGPVRRNFYLDMFEIRFESPLSYYKNRNHRNVSRTRDSIIRPYSQSSNDKRVFIRQSGCNNCQSITVLYSLTREYNEGILPRTSLWDYMKLQVKERERDSARERDDVNE